MKAEKRESIFDIRLTRIESKVDWCEAQRSDPILANIIAVRKRTIDLPEMRYPQKALLQRHIGHYGIV